MKSENNIIEKELLTTVNTVEEEDTMNAKEQIKNDIINELEEHVEVVQRESRLNEDISLQYYVSNIKENLETENGTYNNYIDKVLKKEMGIYDVAEKILKEEISSDWTKSELADQISDNIWSWKCELQGTLYELDIDVDSSITDVDSLIKDYIESNYEEIIDNAFWHGLYYNNDYGFWYDEIEYVVQDIIKEKLQNIIGVEKTEELFLLL